MYHIIKPRLCHKCHTELVVAFDVNFIPRDSCPNCNKKAVDMCEQMKELSKTYEIQNK